MSIFSAAALSVLVITLGLVFHSGLCLAKNYLKAKKVGVPFRIIPINHNIPMWMLLDRPVLALVKRLPFGLGENSFTRYNSADGSSRTGTALIMKLAMSGCMSPWYETGCMLETRTL